jgi:1,4-alpha-glucan branching enzyme
MDDKTPKTKRRDDAERPLQDSSAERPSLLTQYDLHLFNEGSHFRLHEHLGARPGVVAEKEGTWFAVWAPNARAVSVVADFNDWSPGRHPLSPRESSGIWEGFIPGVGRGTVYKYHITSRDSDYQVEKADPFAFFAEVAPRTGSVVWNLDYEWGDDRWMKKRAARNALDAPISIYELHVGSWRRVAEEGNRSLSYRELAPELVSYVKALGFTHVEFMPVMEHPFFGSWGYQITGYFAPSSCYGTPQDFMYLIDCLHQADIGVILDWVPSHFPSDEHGLSYFDGTYLFEHQDPKKGYHPDWSSYIFNYGRHEVQAFLISNALFWLDHYHADGLRVDAVASMLYLDYSREAGEWIPNEYGGRENIEAIDFIRRMNAEIYREFPDVQTMAEESTDWPMVSRPTYLGGLGFGLKWDMGWMHDTLQYMALDPVYRQYHHNELTFRMIYAYHENFTLPLSHDEVVHGKGSILRKMSGDDWQKFANLRLLLAYMYAMPGKKLLFMGTEFAQWDEWQHDGSLDWHLLQYEPHAGIRTLITRLNEVYKSEVALHRRDDDPAGFEWIDAHDHQQSCFSFLRWGPEGEAVLAMFNFTPVPRLDYRVGVPRGGYWREILNSDAAEYGGSGRGNLGGVRADAIPSHGRGASVRLTLPPLGAVFLRAE